MEVNPTRTIAELISAISFALDIDEGTKLYHAWRVAIFATELTKLLSPDEKRDIFYASLLHDAGGIGLPDHIIHYLLKEDNSIEAAVLSHPLTSAEIVSQIPNFDRAAKFVLNHHEWHNGKGYPLGRQADEIPKAAQIIRAADQIDILIRKYKIREAVIKAIDMQRNIQFHEQIAEYATVILEDRALFEEAVDETKIEPLFNNTKGSVGEINVPKGVDAIGITCEVFSQLIDTKHPYTIGHSKRVSRYSLLIGLAMNLAHDELTKVKWAGLLHDIGKLGVSRKILDKPAGLTEGEYETIKQHALLTREILQTITDFKEIALIAGSDHERYDGRGYPQGLKADDIPLGTKIIAIADAFDAMTSDRPYRKLLSAEEACEELKRSSGTQFDPAVVKEAIPVLHNLLSVMKNNR